MTLEAFLSYFDFDYRMYDNSTFSLVDLQGANLGNIESERFSMDTKGIMDCIERMDIYVMDYVLRPVEEQMNMSFNSVKDILDYAHESDEHALKVSCCCDMDIINAICNPETISIYDKED